MKRLFETDDRNRILRTRKCKISLKSVVLAAGILFVAVLLMAMLFRKYGTTGKVKIVRNVSYIISDTEDGIEDAANSLERNVETLSKLDSEGGWSLLSLEEKADVLMTVIKVECRHLGMRDSAPTLAIERPTDDIEAKYDYTTDVITLSYSFMEEHKEDGFVIAEALCGEMFYRYQSYMADIPKPHAELMPLVGGDRYKPVFDRISEELAESEYGNERIEKYQTAVWRYLAGVED